MTLVFGKEEVVSSSLINSSMVAPAQRKATF